MNKKLYIFFLILLGFFLNIFFYIFSDNYRYFLQSFKSSNGYEVNDRLEVNLDNIVLDEKIVDNQESVFSGLQENFFENNKETKLEKKQKVEVIKSIKLDNKKDEKKKVEYFNDREVLKITNIEKDILKKFKEYELKQIELHPRLFDLTSEYPDEYFEYYSKDLTLYFFGNKMYSDLKDIFEVLTYELPFSIKEVNNFGQKSFYINLNELFDDGYIRIILQKSNRIFGIKIKKELYNKIKNNLAIILK